MFAFWGSFTIIVITLVSQRIFFVYACAITQLLSVTISLFFGGFCISIPGFQCFIMSLRLFGQLFQVRRLRTLRTALVRMTSPPCAPHVVVIREGCDYNKISDISICIFKSNLPLAFAEAILCWMSTPSSHIQWYFSKFNNLLSVS